MKLEELPPNGAKTSSRNVDSDSVGRERTKAWSGTPYWPSDSRLFSLLCLRRRRQNIIATDMMARKTTPETTPATIGVIDDFELLELVELVAVCVGDDVASPMVEVVNDVVEPARPAPMSRDAVGV